MKQTAVEWLINEMHKRERGLIETSYNHLFDQAKEMEKQQKGYSEEEVYKLLDIVLINPSHITMLKSGYGQFPDTYEITEKGVDYIIEQFKKK